MPKLRVCRHISPLTAAVLALAACEGTIVEGSLPGRDPATAGAGSPLPVGPAAAGSDAASEPKDAAMRAANPTLFERALDYFPEQTATGSPARLFRLTRAQLDVTTQALLPALYEEAVAATMPRDPLQTNYEYAANLSWNAANFTPYTRWVDALAASARATPEAVIACEADEPVCHEQQTRRFVARAFRGVAPTAVLDRYAAFVASSVAEVGLPEAAAELVSLTLTSPHYVFRDEAPADGSLSAEQQLQNISYTLADSPPEAVGLDFEDAAAHVATPEALQSTIDRVLRSPAAREKLMRFFIAWLEVKEPDDFAIATDLFPEFTPELAAAVVEETRAFLNHQLSGAAPKLKAVTQSTQSFVSDALASIYGTRGGSGDRLVDLDPRQRLGIFTLPAVIASHSGPTTTRLVKRGVFFTRKVMCLPLGLPPPGINTTLPETEGATERERVEAATASGQCRGCHAFINPFGFMQENYDPIGRWRTTDHGRPIDASIEVDFLDEGKLVTASPVEAFRGLTDSLRFQQCFARQVFRFYMGRDEQAGDDPVLREMFFGFANSGEQNIAQLLQTLARSASFTQRVEAP